MKVVAEVKKWGNSLGIVIPKEKANKLSISEKDKIIVEISRMQKIDAFGITKGAGKFKEEELIRGEFDSKWENADNN